MFNIWFGIVFYTFIAIWVAARYVTLEYYYVEHVILYGASHSIVYLHRGYYVKPYIHTGQFNS